MKKLLLILFILITGFTLKELDNIPKPKSPEIMPTPPASTYIFLRDSVGTTYPRYYTPTQTNTQINTLINDSAAVWRDSVAQHRTEINTATSKNNAQDDSLSSHRTEINTATSTNNTQGDTLTARRTELNSLQSQITANSIVDSIYYDSKYSSFTNLTNDINIGEEGSLGSFAAYGNMIQDSDSTFFIRSNNTDNVVMHKSTDGGYTYAAATNIYTRVDANTYIGSVTGNVIDGTWYLVFTINDNTTDSTTAMYSVKSTDYRATWSSEASIPRTLQSNPTSDIRKTSGGRLIVAFHDLPIIGSWASADSGYVKVGISDDDAVTWSSNIVARYDYDTTQFSQPDANEPALGIVNDTLLMVCRVEIYGSAIYTSIDTADTWTYEGMLGQTLSPAKNNGYNAASDILAQGTKFLIMFGHRTDLTAAKKGYIQGVTCTYTSIHGNPATGATTLIEPVYVANEPGSMRIAINSNGDLVMGNGNTNEYYVIQKKYLTQMRSYTFKSNQYNGYKVIPVEKYELPYGMIINNTDWATIGQTSFPAISQADGTGIIPIGTIPVIQISYRGTQINNPDSVYFKLTDLGGLQMEGMSLIVTGGASYPNTDWLPFIPTRTNTGTHQVGFEQYGILVKAKATNTNDNRIDRLTVELGYIPR